MAVAAWGKNIVETDVDRAFLKQIAFWLPTYLTQEERDRELALHTLARPHDGSYQNALTDAEFPDGRLPAIVVTTARARDVAKGPDGYGATYQVTVSAIVRGTNPTVTREVAALFGGAVKRLLRDQQIELEGEVEWTGGSVIPVPDELDVEGRYLAASVQTFDAIVDEVLTGDGPLYPDADPYPPPDPVNDPDAPWDPLAKVTNVTTTISPRS